MSSKGQVVIPRSIREIIGLQDGSCLSVSTQDGIVVLKKVECDLEAENLKTLEEIKEAWGEIRDGKYKKMSGKDFLNEIKKW